MNDDNRPQPTERDNRAEALNNAARHRLGTEKPEDVVKAAELYFAFLQGDESK